MNLIRIVFFLTSFLLSSSAYPMNQPNSTLPINPAGFAFLPQEILWNIFRTIELELPWQSVHFFYQLSKVCKNWNVVIISHPNLIRKILKISPLCWAAALGQVDNIIKLKLDGFSLREPDERGFRPAHFAIGCRQLDAMGILRVGIALETECDGPQALEAYIQEGDEETRNFLLSFSCFPDPQDVRNIINQLVKKIEENDEDNYTIILREHDQAIENLSKLKISESNTGEITEQLVAAAKADDYDSVLVLLTKNPYNTLNLSTLNISKTSKIYQLLMFHEQAGLEHKFFDHADEFEQWQDAELNDFFTQFNDAGANPNTFDHDGQALLHLASSYSEYCPVVKKLLACKNINPNIGCIQSGWTPLHCAASHGSYACLVELLNTPTCTINCVDNKGKTPLRLAIENNHDKCANLLKERGGTIYNTSKWTALHHAAYQGDYNKLYELLCDDQVDVNSFTDDINGLTPLHCAAMSYNLDCVRLLIDHGASVHAVSKEGMKPSSYAAANKDEHCFDFLKKYLVTDIPEKSFYQNLAITGGTLLHMASYDGTYDMLKKLLNGKDCHNVDHPDDHGRTALHYAAARGDIEHIQLLIASGASIMCKDNKGETPVAYAIRANQKAAIEFLHSVPNNKKNHTHSFRSKKRKKTPDNPDTDRPGHEKCAIQ